MNNLTCKYKITILHKDGGISYPIFDLIYEGRNLTIDETYMNDVRKFAEVNFNVKLPEIVDISVSQPIYEFKDMVEWCKLN